MADAQPYLDTSATVRLFLTEAHGQALREALARERRPLTSEIGRIEATRVGRRRGVPREAAVVLGAMDILPLDADIRHRAALLDPPGLRTLDAIHLATALSVPISAFYTYDDRLVAAAHAAGLPVASPRG